MGLASASAGDGLLSFGPYELVDRIAKGELSDVFAARMLVDDGARPVALKRFDPAFSEEEGFAKILLDEVQMASRLVHPNIAAVYDYGIIDGSCYLATELIDGVDVGYLIEQMSAKGQSIPAELALHICLSACDALAHAHRARKPDVPLGLVHRDLNPRNIMLTFDGVVKLTDFGVVHARRYLREIITELSRDQCGYLSPEEIQGSSVDGRSDIFSLATVLHELLTGVALFARASSVSTVQRLLRAEIPPPSRTNSRVAPQLDKILLRALSRDVGARYQTAEALRDDLHGYARDASMLVEKADLARWLREHLEQGPELGLMARVLGESAGQVHKPAPGLDHGEADEPTDTNVDALAAAPRTRNRRPTLSQDDDLSTTRKRKRQLQGFSDEFERSTVRNAKMADRPVRGGDPASSRDEEDLADPTETGATPAGYVYSNTAVDRDQGSDAAEDTATDRSSRSSAVAQSEVARPHPEDPMPDGQVQQSTPIEPATLPAKVVDPGTDLPSAVQFEEAIPTLPRRQAAVDLASTLRDEPTEPPTPIMVPGVRQGGLRQEASEDDALVTSPRRAPVEHNRPEEAAPDALLASAQRMAHLGETIKVEAQDSMLPKPPSTGPLPPGSAAQSSSPGGSAATPLPATGGRGSSTWRWVGLLLIVVMLAAGGIGAFLLAKAKGRRAASERAPADQVLTSPE